MGFFSSFIRSIKKNPLKIIDPLSNFGIGGSDVLKKAGILPQSTSAPAATSKKLSNSAASGGSSSSNSIPLLSSIPHAEQFKGIT